MALEAKLPKHTAASLADLVRVMNCYYSNLIEGHITRPLEIERALNQNLDQADEEKRDLQIEALAHIRVQKQIDASYAQGELGEPWSREFLASIHYEFYRDAPERMLQVRKSDGTILTMRPGEFRSLPEEDVEVGQHISPTSQSLPLMLEDFENGFRAEGLAPASAIIASAIAHHRFEYIHPFLDGNGRVGRLASHAMLLKAGVGAHCLWSISRGLARGTSQGPDGRNEYKSMLNMADQPRRHDLDGRGNLSQEATIEFVRWWLAVCLDQITFMSKQFDLDRIEERFAKWLAEESLSKAMGIIEECLRRGEMRRGDAARVTGMSERSARTHLGQLERLGVLSSDKPKGPVWLQFTPSSSRALFPNLFEMANQN